MFLSIAFGITASLATYYIYRKCIEKKRQIDAVFDLYSPSRNVKSSRTLRLHLIDKTLSFLDRNTVYMSHRMFKTLEFYVAEKILLYAMDTINKNDECVQIKNIVKIDKLIYDYKNIFYEHNELMTSLTHKVYRNMLSINTDIYILYKTVNNILKTTIKREINNDMLSVYKNFYWYNGMRYKGKSLITFIRNNFN